MTPRVSWASPRNTSGLSALRCGDRSSHGVQKPALPALLLFVALPQGVEDVADGVDHASRVVA
jgi:hypothetical protein